MDDGEYELSRGFGRLRQQDAFNLEHRTTPVFDGRIRDPPRVNTRRGHRGPFLCQVEGCSRDLSAEKKYYKRHRMCPEHLAKDHLLVNGLLQRFCQQHNTFHPLSQFHGANRSCIDGLKKHQASRRRLRKSANSGSEKNRNEAAFSSQPENPGASDDVQSMVGNREASYHDGQLNTRSSMSIDQVDPVDDLEQNEIDFLGEAQDFWQDGLPAEDLDLLCPLDMDFSNHFSQSEHGFHEQNSQPPAKSNAGDCAGRTTEAHSGEAQNAPNTGGFDDMVTSPCTSAQINQGMVQKPVAHCSSASSSSGLSAFAPHQLPMHTAGHTGPSTTVQAPIGVIPTMGMPEFPFGTLHPMDPQQMGLHLPPNNGCLDNNMAMAFTGLAGALDQSLISRFLAGYPAAPPIPGVPWSSGFRPVPALNGQIPGQMYGTKFQSLQKHQQGFTDSRLGPLRGPPVWPLGLQPPQNLLHNMQQLPQESNQPRPPVPAQLRCEIPSEPQGNRPLEIDHSPAHASGSQSGAGPMANAPGVPQFQGIRTEGSPMQDIQVSGGGQLQQMNQPMTSSSFDLLRNLVGTVPTTPIDLGGLTNDTPSVKIMARVSLKVESNLPPDMSGNIIKRLSAAFPEDCIVVDSAAREGCTNFIFDIVSLTGSIADGTAVDFQRSGQRSSTGDQVDQTPATSSSGCSSGAQTHPTGGEDAMMCNLLQSVTERLSCLEGREYEFVRSAPAVLRIGRHISILGKHEYTKLNQNASALCRPAIIDVLPSCVLACQETKMGVLGQHILEPATLFCRFQGCNRSLMLTPLPQAQAEERFGVRGNSSLSQCQFPALPSCGIAFMECELEQMLSSPQPVLVVNSVEVMVEVRELVSRLGRSERHVLLTQVGLILSHMHNLSASEVETESSESEDTESVRSDVSNSSLMPTSDSGSENTSISGHEEDQQVLQNNSCGQPVEMFSGNTEERRLSMEEKEVHNRDPCNNDCCSEEPSSADTIAASVNFHETGHQLGPDGAGIQGCVDIPGLEPYNETQLPEYSHIIAEWGRQHLAFFCRRGCVALAKSMMPAAQLGCITFSSVVAHTCFGRLSLLHQAVLSGNPLMVQTVLNWGQQYRFDWDWNTTGPKGITPLHCAAMQRNGCKTLQIILKHSADACLQWFMQKTWDGATPGDFAELSGFHQANEIMRIRALELYEQQGYPGTGFLQETHGQGIDTNNGSSVQNVADNTRDDEIHHELRELMSEIPKKEARIVKSSNDGSSERLDSETREGRHWTILSNSAIWMAMSLLAVTAMLAYGGPEITREEACSLLLLSSVAMELGQAFWSFG